MAVRHIINLVQHFSNKVLSPYAKKATPTPLQGTACLAPGGRLLLRARMPGARRRPDSWRPMTTNIAIVPHAYQGFLATHSSLGPSLYADHSQPAPYPFPPRALIFGLFSPPPIASISASDAIH